MKQQIIDFLVENGFSAAPQENQYMKRVRRVASEAIVNGERHVEYSTLEIRIEFIGDCWEGNSETDNHPLTQWKLRINGEDHGDFLVHDLEEFKNIFR